ncbi:MAG TPA: glycosyltransferase, partial [Ramlibacter sp.]
MRFHVVALPHTHVTSAFASCAFSQKVLRFCQMMTGLGHEVFLYAGEQNDAPVAEHIVCVSEADRAVLVGDRHYTAADWGHPGWHTFNSKVIDEMGSRLQQKDFICLIGGYAQKPIADAFPNHISVEFGIGYAGTFAKFRVFESYAWMHMVYGAQAGSADRADGNWYDAVIPNQVDGALFPDPEIREPQHGGAGMRGPLGPRTMPDGAEVWPSKAEEDAARAEERLSNRIHDISCKQCREWIAKSRSEENDYYLYVGRLIDRKGYRIAQEVCESLGKRLVLAGPGEHHGYGEFVGEVGPYHRYRLMSGAIALFAPTIYVEPFGTVHIEAMACGTPVISTDWGVFTETIEQGVNGFRCRDFSEFCNAANKVKDLDRQ